MKLKSITLTTGIFPPDIGGPASFIPILAEKLVKKNIQVNVVTLSDQYLDYSYLPYKVTSINRKIKKPFRDFLVIKEIIKSSKNSDLIFSNTLAFESVIASKIIGKKLVQKVVGDLAWERANSSGRFKRTLEEYQNDTHLCLKSKFTNIYRNFGVKHSDFIITPSMYLKNIVTNWGYPKEKIEVIYNAVEFEQADKQVSKDKFRIISVARLIPHKGIETVLKVLAKLNFDFEYIVIGDGPLKKKLEDLSNELDLDVKFLGKISKKEVANWLNNSDLFILNSSYEGLPHILLESMQNECPVIASRVGGTPEIVRDGENGLLFQYNNRQELLEKIYLLKNNANLRKKIIKNGKEFVRQFANVDKMVDKYLELFERLL